MEVKKTRRPFSYGHLYVMQASCGLIKVGRSIDPERRRFDLSLFIVEDLALVAVLPDRGKDEEAAHIALKRFRRHKEWFTGTDVARKAVERVLGLKDTLWPYAWNTKVADELLAHLRYNRNRRWVTKYRRELINDLKNRVSDEFIRSRICAAAVGPDGLVICMDRANPRVEVMETGEVIYALDYLADHDTAAKVGPPGWVWEDEPGVFTPAQVVIAGLEARTRWERQQMAAEDEGADEDLPDTAADIA
jgi:hypothetical protein